MQKIIEGVLRDPKIGEALGAALKGAQETRGQLDRNLQMLLSALNLPSRADFERLEAKVESLQGSLVNLNIKLDRLLAEKPDAKRAAPRRTQRPRPGASRRKPE